MKALASAITILCALVVMIPQALGDALVTSQFDPPTIAAGQASRYVVQVRGTTGSVAFSPPAAPGLVFEGTQQSQRTSIINGKVQHELTLVSRVRAAQPGKFTVPGHSLRVGGEMLNVPPAVLQVVPADQAPKQPEDPALAALSGSMPQLTLALQQEKIYVGQTVPVSVTLVFPSWVEGRLERQAPEQVGDAFSMGTLSDEPVRDAVNLGGRQYQKLTWASLLTPLKAGKYPLSFKLGVIVLVPRSDDFPGGNFPGGFFGNVFAEQRQLPLSTPAREIEVLPLPEQGKPATYSGAIGHFTLSAPALSATRLEVGEPVTVTLSVTGRGNFDLIEPPPVPANPLWKTYAPKATFKAADAHGNSGTKTFEYVLVPMSEQADAVPEIRFSYFDPEKSRYETLVAARTPVRVLAPTVPGGGRPAPSHTAVTPVQRDPAAAPVELLPIRLQPGRTVDRLAPVFTKPLFWLVQAGALLAVVALAFLGRWCTRWRDDKALRGRREAQRVLAAAISGARDAAARHDIEAFFGAARRAIQAAAWHEDGAPKEALAGDELLAWLEQRGTPAPALESARALLAEADAAQYGGVTVAQPQDSLRRLELLVASLRTRS